MLEYASQCPLSLPYPGWEHYHKPWDGRTNQTTRPHGNLSPLEASSEKRKARKDVDKFQSAQAGEYGAWVATSNIKVSPSVVKDNAWADKDVVEVPSWAVDVDGYCCFVKRISRRDYYSKL